MRSQWLLLFLLLALPLTARGQSEAEYRLGIDDVVRVQVWGREDLSGQVVVDPNGDLTLPLLGAIKASGQTTIELGKDLRKRYAILDSQISEVLVSVVQYDSRRVTVVGEVHKPGPYGFPIIPNLWEVILAAGGPTPTADLSRVQIVRKEREPGENAITVDLSKGLEKTDLDSLPEVRPRDTVVVPSADPASTAGRTEDSFQVLGSVKTPGTYRLTRAETVIEALAASGGALPEADLSSVHLSRTTSTGLLAYELDVEGHLERGKPIADLKLEPGDTILVRDKDGWTGKLLDSFVRYAVPIVTVWSSLIVISNR